MLTFTSPRLKFVWAEEVFNERVVRHVQRNQVTEQNPVFAGLGWEKLVIRTSASRWMRFAAQFETWADVG